MRVCGIIAEYDPFHLGHLHHVNVAREQSGADYVVCVISSAFTQRGLPGLFSTHDRASMALSGGADLVLGMPVAWSCAQANRFAAGGVGILNALGVVTHLAFGVEPDALPWLQKAAELMRNPTPAYQARLAQELSAGHPLARAQGEALADTLDGAQAHHLSRPNFVLAACYLQALSAFDSRMTPVPVPRQGGYHDTQLTPLPSATAVRAALLRGDWQGVKRSVPPTTYEVMALRAAQGALHRPGALDASLLERLLHGGLACDTAELSEGLDQRILSKAKLATGREELVSLVKTRRYPRARIQRALSGMLLGLQAEVPPAPPYARLLGLRKRAEPLLTAIKQGGFPLVDRPARERGTYIEQDMRAEQLWYLGAGQPAARAWQQKMPRI